MASGFVKHFLLPLGIGLLLLFVPLDFINRLRLGVQFVQSPLSNVIYHAKYRVASLVPVFKGDWDRQDQLEKLAEENAQLRGQLVQLSDRVNELELSLKRAGVVRDMLEASAFTAVPARVISRNYEMFFDEVTINLGEADGIEAGMGVIQGQYVLGKVHTVGKWTSQVALITSESCKISAKILRNQKQGLLAGGAELDAGLGCKLSYVSEEKGVNVKVSVKEGDRIVTSGTDPAFVPGMPVGDVSKVRLQDEDLFYDIQVKPMADLSTIYSVLVLKQAGVRRD